MLPASALFGAAFLVGCDLVARTILAPVELAGRHHHRAHRRAVLSMAADEKTVRQCCTRLLMALCLADRVRVSADSPHLQISRSPDPTARIISLVPAVTEMLYRDRRGPAGGRGKQLRQVSAGGEEAAERRRPAGSERRAHPLAETGSRRSSMAARTIWTAARTRRHRRLRLPPCRPRRRDDDDPRAGRAHGRRREGGRRRRTDRTWPRGDPGAGQGPAAAADDAGLRPRARWRCAAFTRAAASVSCNDMLQMRPAASTCSPTCKMQSVQAEHGTDPRPASRRDPGDPRRRTARSRQAIDDRN